MCGNVMRIFSRALGMEPKMPAMPAPPVAAPAPPEVDTGAAEAERRRQRAARGRAATLLTGGQGDTSAVSIARPAAGGARTLLG